MDKTRQPVGADSRIIAYRDAAIRLARGDFSVQFPVHGSDDVTRLGEAMRQLAETLERKFREISELARITERVNAGLILDEVLEYVYASFREIIPYDRIGFALLEAEGRVLRARWAHSEAPVIRIGPGYTGVMKGSSLQTVLETGRPRILNDLVEYLYQHPDSDSTRLMVEEGVRSSLTCPLITEGKAIGFIFFSSFQSGTYRDAHIELFLQIAGQLAAIVEKSRLYKELVELSEAKTRFLGMAAHDLRNPIGVIQSYATLLREGVLGDVTPVQKSYFEKIEDSCGAMLQLINELLDVSAIESGQLVLEKTKAPLEPFLRECIEVERMLAARKNIRLELEIVAPLPEVPFDARRMQQVVGNLVSNAVKYSHSDTTVRVRASADRERPGVVVEVIDQGQGIPEHEVPRLFHDFARTSVKPTRGERSTGLGLSIVRRIVTAHGGTVSVESTVGEGSTFRFTLPAE